MRRGVAARQAERWKAQAGSRRFVPDARIGIHNWTGDITSWADPTAGGLTGDVDIAPARGIDPAFVL
jgi:hypothetical protein